MFGFEVVEEMGYIGELRFDVVEDDLVRTRCLGWVPILGNGVAVGTTSNRASGRRRPMISGSCLYFGFRLSHADVEVCRYGYTTGIQIQMSWAWRHSLELSH